MKARRLRHTVTLERRATAQDSAGQRNDVWSLIATTRASIDDTGGREGDQRSGEFAKTVTEIWLRWQAKLADLSPADRLVHGAVVYDIKSIKNPQQRNHELILVCQRNA